MTSYDKTDLSNKARERGGAWNRVRAWDRLGVRARDRADVVKF